VRVRVVVVAGPSGSGKSRLCARLHRATGVPVVNLDDFYKDGDDPSLPRREQGSGRWLVDWDDPASWSRAAAVDALETLCRDGAAELPVYDISRDARVGTVSVRLGDVPYVVAEGLFAQEVVPDCVTRGLLADAVCVRNHRVVTFWRRLTRDLREHRKPPLLLVRRGIALLRAEPRVAARAVQLGAVPMTPDQAYRRLLATVRTVPT
jgi:uridine kinase